jgi:hypothetical protein
MEVQSSSVHCCSWLLCCLILSFFMMGTLRWGRGPKMTGWLEAKDLRILCRKSKVWLFASCGLCVLKCSSGVVGLPCGGHMVSINEELRAAKAAKAAISSLSTTPLSKSVFLATLNRANHAAILNLSSGGALNEARGNIGLVLSNLMFGPRTPEKIDKAKFAIEAWIRELEASPAP